MTHSIGTSPAVIEKRAGKVHKADSAAYDEARGRPDELVLRRSSHIGLLPTGDNSALDDRG